MSPRSIPTSPPNTPRAHPRFPSPIISCRSFPTHCSPFVNGDLLQVLFIAILTGFACSRLGSFGTQVAHGLENATKVLFSIIRIIVWSASVGAFGAMAFTIGRYGVQSLVPLAVLIATFYLTAFLFVVFVLGSIARAAGFS